jgi:hypothetical protein
MTDGAGELVARLPRGHAVVATWSADGRQRRRMRAAWSTEAALLVVATERSRSALVAVLERESAERVELRIVVDLAAATALASVDGLEHADAS